MLTLKAARVQVRFCAVIVLKRTVSNIFNLLDYIGNSELLWMY